MDMHSKHTPGPWDVDEGDKSTIYELDAANPIAEVFSDRSAEENEANARLIAAAPELLDALTALLDEAEDVFVCMADATGIDRHNLPPQFAAARAAIAKAEGR